MRLDDEKLDQLLTTHFDRALGSQLGRAEAVFRSKTNLPARRRSTRRWWLAGGLATAAAVVWALTVLRPGQVQLNPALPPVQTHKLDPNARDLQFTAYTRTLDDGLVYLDAQTPVHQLRRQEVQQVQWLDDDGKTKLKITVPKEQVLLVDYVKN